MYTLFIKIVLQIAMLMILATKKTNTEPPEAKVSDFDFPTAEENRSQMILYGKRKISGANNIFADDVSQEKMYEGGGWFSPEILVGIKYYIGFAMGICYGGETQLIKISIKDEEVWKKTDETYDVNGKLRGNINLPNFHDDKNGLSGNFSFYQGSETQIADPYISKFYSTPSWRGLSYIVFEKFYVGNSTNVSVFDFLLKRIPTTNTILDNYADVLDNCNPVVVLYDILTNYDYGLGISKDLIDLESFEKTAKTLKDENIGLSITYEDKVQGDKFVSEVLKYISGVMTEDYKTGLFKLKLIRDDYNVDEIFEFNTKNIININSYSRNTQDKLYNEVKVSYSDENNFYKSRPAQFQNQALSMEKDGINTFNVAYPWVTRSEIANNFAMRDAIPATVYMSSIELESVKVYGLEVGDAVKINFPPYGISQMIFRISEIDYGSFRNNTMRISLLQDNFGIQLSSYSPPTENQWNGFDFKAQPCYINVIETPYFFKDDGFNIMTFGEKPSSVSLNYEIYTKNIDRTTYNFNGSSNNFTATGLSENEISISQTSIKLKGDLSNIKDFTDAELLKGANLCLIKSESGEEFINFNSITYNELTDEYTINNVSRGLLDTIPKKHLANTKIWFISYGYAFNNYQFSANETINIKPLTITTSEKLNIEKAIKHDFNFGLNERNNYPPAPINLRINDQIFWNYSIDQVDLKISALIKTYEEMKEIRGYFNTKPPAFGNTELTGNIPDKLIINIYDVDNKLLKNKEILIGKTYPLDYDYIFDDEKTINPNGEYYQTLKLEIYSEFQGLKSIDKYNLEINRV